MKAALARKLDSLTAKIEGKKTEAHIAKVRSCRVALAKAIAEITVTENTKSVDDTVLMQFVNDVNKEIEKLKK